jgi:hypothetical protein
MKRISLLMFALALLTQACKNDGCNQPMAFNFDPDGTDAEACIYAPVTLEVEFLPYFGDEELSTSGSNSFKTEDGRSIELEHFGVYLTEMAIKVGEEYRSLAEAGDCLARTSDAHLFKNDQRVYRVEVLPEDNFEITGLRFNIGVDECRNDSLDPTTQTEGPFMPQVPTMYWSWATGYRFVSIDGRLDASANADSSLIAKFEYHTGLNQLLRTVELETEALTLADGTMHLDVKVDLAQIFTDVDFTTEWVTHTSNNLPLAEKVTENATTMFSIQSVNQP